jgi:nitrate reductase molybdenum cofactor assembly chaperone NarJ/NarW
MSEGSPRRAKSDDLLVLRALAALLTYPGRDVLAALPEIRAAAAGSPLLTRDDEARLARLIDDLGQTDPLLLEERYVQLFDRGRTTSLHLFEHVHGESRDRGPAMVDLVQIYEKAGLRLVGNELPDYLPAVLEYLSCRPLAEARAMLDDCAHIVRKVGETLAQRGSHYAAVLAAVLSVAGLPGLDWSRAVEPAPAEPPIDEEWADAPAFAGPAPPDNGPQTSVMQFVPRRADPAGGTRQGGKQ